MGLETYIVNLRDRYKSARTKSSECEEILIKIKDVTINKIQESYFVKKVVYDIYRYMIQSKKDSSMLLPENDVENQLLYIKRMLYELQKINKLIRKEQKKIKNKH